MSNVDFLRRAFELADSGNYSSVSSIRAALVREHFTLHQLSQLAGRQLSKQLRDRMTAAQKSKNTR